MSRDKILAKLPRMSAACLRANGLTQPPAVDMSHDPHDVTPAKATLHEAEYPGGKMAGFLVWSSQNPPAA